MKNRPRESPIPSDFGGFIKFVEIDESLVKSWDEYPDTIAAVRAMGRLQLDAKVTFLVGENGSGKSTLIEAIAIAAGFNAEGGTKGFDFATKRSDSPLHDALTIARGPYRERDGFFLRAESGYNFASDIDRMERERIEERLPGGSILNSYGGKSLHERSHGESFLAIVQNRFGGNGIYVLDEPESALSPARQLALLMLIHTLAEQRQSQFVIATHSPILLAYPDALIYSLNAEGLEKVEYEETDHYRLTRDFLNNTSEAVARALATTVAPSCARASERT